MQRVKSVEELFLRSLLLSEKLNVVDEQQVDIAELVPKTGHLVVAQRVDHLVRELLARHVADRGLWHALLHFVPDRLHQVGLAHSYPAVQEERVVGLRRTLSNSARCGMCELIAAADQIGRASCRERV